MYIHVCAVKERNVYVTKLYYIRSRLCAYNICACTCALYVPVPGVVNLVTFTYL